MIKKKVLKIVDNTLKDICNNSTIFGEKLIILGEIFGKYNQKRNIVFKQL